MGRCLIEFLMMMGVVVVIGMVTVMGLSGCDHDDPVAYGDGHA